MSLLVVDASVAAKWLLPAAQEPLVNQATHLLAQETKGGTDFIVPDLFWPEIGNVLWKAVRRERITPTQAEECLATALSWAFDTISSRHLVTQALEIGLKHQRSFYDSIYLALAVSQKIEFITADERLANAVAAYLPVKWLGGI